MPSRETNAMLFLKTKKHLTLKQSHFLINFQIRFIVFENSTVIL